MSIGKWLLFVVIGAAIVLGGDWALTYVILSGEIQTPVDFLTSLLTFDSILIALSGIFFALPNERIPYFAKAVLTFMTSIPLLYSAGNVLYLLLRVRQTSNGLTVGYSLSLRDPLTAAVSTAMIGVLIWVFVTGSFSYVFRGQESESETGGSDKGGGPVQKRGDGRSPASSRSFSAKQEIGVIAFVLIVVGSLVASADANLGYTIVGLGGGVLLTYLVVDVLLVREQRRNWATVKAGTMSVINSELRGIGIDTMLFAGAQDGAFTIPEGLTSDQERMFFAEQHLKDARHLAKDLGALREKDLPNILNTRGLFENRADRLASFQNRYWSRLLQPELMAYLISLESKLRRVDMSLEIYRKYNEFPKPTGDMAKIREWEIGSSHEGLYQDMQALLLDVIKGIDEKVIPYD
jgi:hypothetical protein